MYNIEYVYVNIYYITSNNIILANRRCDLLPPSKLNTLFGNELFVTGNYTEYLLYSFKISLCIPLFH